MTKITNSLKGFQFTIKNLYDIEKQLEVALPKMAKAASNEELAVGFEEHLQETKDQSKRLEKIFKLIDAPSEKHAGKGIRGIIADGRAIIASEAPTELKDAMLAAAGRDVENYEIACYLNAIEEARGLGLSEAEGLLQESLVEEQTADDKLKVALKRNLQLAEA